MKSKNLYYEINGTWHRVLIVDGQAFVCDIPEGPTPIPDFDPEKLLEPKTFEDVRKIWGGQGSSRDLMRIAEECLSDVDIIV